MPRSVNICLVIACLAIVTSQSNGADKPWPFCDPQASEPPRVHNSAWVINEIDQFVLSTLEQHELSPAPQASKRSLLGDVHATILNLLGLDDDQLRYLHAGRLRQLTDIGGHVLDEVIV